MALVREADAGGNARNRIIALGQRRGSGGDPQAPNIGGDRLLEGLTEGARQPSRFHAHRAGHVGEPDRFGEAIAKVVLGVTQPCCSPGVPSCSQEVRQELERPGLNCQWRDVIRSLELAFHKSAGCSGEWIADDVELARELGHRRTLVGGRQAQGDHARATAAEAIGVHGPRRFDKDSARLALSLVTATDLREAAAQHDRNGGAGMFVGA